MVGAAGGTVLDALLSRPTRIRTGVLLGGQGLLYGLAAAGGRLPRQAGPLRPTALGARYLVRTSWTSSSGLLNYLRGRNQLHLWERATRG